MSVKRTNFTSMSSGHHRIKWRRNIAENFNRLSRVHANVTDRRQTDRRRTTDGRTTTYSEHEHKNRLSTESRLGLTHHAYKSSR